MHPSSSMIFLLSSTILMNFFVLIFSNSSQINETNLQSQISTVDQQQQVFNHDDKNQEKSVKSRKLIGEEQEIMKSAGQTTSILQSNRTRKTSDSSSSINVADKFYYWKFGQTAGAIIIFVMIVVGNLSILHRLKSCRRRRSNVNYFIVQLAIADLFVGCFSVTLDSFLRLQKEFNYGPLACRVSKYISVLFIYSSTYLLVALSIDRWEAVVKPLAFTRNRSRGYYLVAGAWILAFIGAMPVTLYTKIKEFGNLPQCWIELNPLGWKVYMVYLTCSLLIIPAFIIAICYTHIVYTIWRKGQLVKTKNNNINTNSINKDEQNNAAKLIDKRKVKLNSKSKFNSIDQANFMQEKDLKSSLNSDARTQKLNTADLDLVEKRDSNGQAMFTSGINISLNYPAINNNTVVQPDCGSTYNVNQGTLLDNKPNKQIEQVIQQHHDQIPIDVDKTYNGSKITSLVAGKVATSNAQADNLSQDTEDEYMSTDDDEEIEEHEEDEEEDDDVEEGDEEEEFGLDITEGMKLDSFHDQRKGAPKRQKQMGELGSAEIGEIGGLKLASNTNINEKEANIVPDASLKGKIPLFWNGDNLDSQNKFSLPLYNPTRLATTTTGTPLHQQLEILKSEQQNSATCTTSKPNEQFNNLIEKKSIPLKPTTEVTSFRLKKLKKQSAVEKNESFINMQDALSNGATKSNQQQKRDGLALLKKSKTIDITTTTTTTTGAMSVSSTNFGKNRRIRKRNIDLNNSAEIKLVRNTSTGNNNSNHNNGTQQHGSGVIPQARIKTIKMTLVIVAAFILCWAPFYIINLCSVFGLIKKETNFTMALKTLTQSLAHLNSAVNPIIFWLFSSKRNQHTITRSSAKLTNLECQQQNQGKKLLKSTTWLGRKFSIPNYYYNNNNNIDGNNTITAGCGQTISEIYYIIKKYLCCCCCCLGLDNNNSPRRIRMFESTGTSAMRSQRIPSSDMTVNSNFIQDNKQNIRDSKNFERINSIQIDKEAK